MNLFKKMILILNFLEIEKLKDTDAQILFLEEPLREDFLY